MGWRLGLGVGVEGGDRWLIFCWIGSVCVCGLELEVTGPLTAFGYLTN